MIPFPNHTRRSTFLLRFTIFTVLLCSGDVLLWAQQDHPQFDWKVGVKNTYDLTFDETHGAVDLKTTGSVTFKVIEDNVSSDFDAQPDEESRPETSTSTAFLVNSDGYLITCAHCVQNSKEILVRIDGKQYPAKIVAEDRSVDLALLKIDPGKAKGTWSVLRLGTDRPVNLAQDVRAIGYPLSSMLGSSVKVVRGGIAGFIGDDQNDYRTAQSYQIDAAVNPGNSGGPLVDDTGAVIGVVNAKTVSREISPMGFAIPCRYAIKLLKENNVTFQNSESNQSLSGPEIAKRLTPALAYVEATTDANLTDNLLIAVTGELIRVGQADKFSAHVIIDKGGEVINIKGNSKGKGKGELRSLLTSIATMPFLETPLLPLPKWSRHTYFKVDKTERRSRGSIFSRFERCDDLDLFVLRFGRTARNFIVYEMEKNFRLRESPKPEEFLVEMDSTTNPLNKLDGEQISQTANSLWTFDRKSGFPLSRECKGETILTTTSGVKEQFDFRFTMTLKSSEQLAVTRKDKSSRKGERLSINAFKDLPSESPDQLTSEQLDSFVNPAQELELALQLKYLNRMSRWKSAKRSGEVIETLQRLSKDSNTSVKRAAVDALINWSPDDATEVVVAELEKANRFSQRKWIMKLGKTNSALAAEKLCELWESPRLKKTVEQSLKNLGPHAEPTLVKRLVAELEFATSDQPLAADTSARVLMMLTVLTPDASEESKKSLRTFKDSPILSTEAQNALDKILRQ